MEFCSCYPKAGCPGGKPQKTEFRGFFPRKILKKLSNINYINQIAEIKFHSPLQKREGTGASFLY